MNKYILISIGSLAFVCASIVTTKELEEKVAAIQAPRIGITSSDLAGLKDPFIYLDRNKTTGAILSPKLNALKQSADLNLSGIMNGKALVNNSWVSTGEKIGEYTIASIEKNSVVFAKEDTVKRVFVGKKRENIIKLQKGYIR